MPKAAAVNVRLSEDCEQTYLRCTWTRQSAMSTLCQLPDELLLLIFSSFSQHELTTVCVLCHRLQKLGETLLYATFSEVNGDCDRVQRFVLSIVRKPYLTQYCKSLDLRQRAGGWEHGRPWGLLARGRLKTYHNEETYLTEAAIASGLVYRDSTRQKSQDWIIESLGDDTLISGELADLWRTRRASSFAMYASLLLVLLGHVKFAALDPDWVDLCRDLRTSRHRNYHQRPLDRSLTKLNTLVVEGRPILDDFEPFHVNSDLFCTTLEEVSLHELDIRGQLQSPLLPILTTIELDRCHILAGYLEVLLEACDALKFFYYSFPSVHYHASRHVANGVIAALTKHQKHLEVLHITVFRHSTSQYPGRFMGYLSAKHLQYFENLTSLRPSHFTLMNVDSRLHQMVPDDVSSDCYNLIALLSSLLLVDSDWPRNVASAELCLARFSPQGNQVDSRCPTSSARSLVH